jgi:2-dehydropantoate 2-reductase
LVDHRPDRLARLRDRGITVESDEGSFTAKPSVALTVPSGLDLAIVLTKAYSTEHLRLPQNGPVLTLQNGLGNVETLCAIVGSARLLVGATCEAATLLEEGRVRHAGTGPTYVGSWTSCPAEPAVAVLAHAGFNVEATESPGQIVWEKAALSAAINPLTALLNVSNGRLVEIPEIRQLMRDLVVEAVKVASTEGYRFDHSLLETAEELCRQTSSNISSMLQDVRAGKRTEIEAISGEILRRAQNAALPTPRTRVVYQLMKGLEQR